MRQETGGYELPSTFTLVLQANRLTKCASHPYRMSTNYLIQDNSATRKTTLNSSVIRQKAKSKNGGNKKTKHSKLSEKTNIPKPLIRTRPGAYQGVKNVYFFGKIDVLCFLVTSVLRFVFLPYYRRITD